MYVDRFMWVYLVNLVDICRYEYSVYTPGLFVFLYPGSQFSALISSPLPGTHNLRAYDLFGGALCARRSWQMIESAALELWGVQPCLSFSFNVTQWRQFSDMISAVSKLQKGFGMNFIFSFFSFLKLVSDFVMMVMMSWWLR